MYLPIYSHESDLYLLRIQHLFIYLLIYVFIKFIWMYGCVKVIPRLFQRFYEIIYCKMNENITLIITTWFYLSRTVTILMWLVTDLLP